jgi:hypothetical protein
MGVDAMPDAKARRLRRVAHRALTVVWTGLRTRRAVGSSEYAQLHHDMCRYMHSRFGALTPQIVAEVVEECLNRFLSRSFGLLWSGEGASLEDVFPHLDNVALFALSLKNGRPTEPESEDLLPPGTKSDSEYAAGLFGSRIDSRAYRNALAEVRKHGGPNEYLVALQAMDMFVENGRIPTSQDVADRLRRQGITTAMVETLLLNFANRLVQRGVPGQTAVGQQPAAVEREQAAEPHE